MTTLHDPLAACDLMLGFGLNYATSGSKVEDMHTSISMKKGRAGVRSSSPSDLACDPRPTEKPEAHLT